MFILSLVLAVFSVGNSIATIADGADESNLQRSVISADLLAEMEVSAGSHPVCVWISDIDWDAVGDRISDERASRGVLSWEEIKAEEVSIYTTHAGGYQNFKDDVSYTDEMMEELEELYSRTDELVMLEREIASEAYQEMENEFISRAGIEDDIQFASKYAPMMLAELDNDQILALAAMDEVWSIDFNPEVEEEQDAIEDPLPLLFKNENTRDDPDLTYLHYCGVWPLRASGYLLGTNVKVGIVDKYSFIPPQHNDFSQSNITTLTTPGTASQADHAIQCSRIIAGRYGVAPRCHLYSYGAGTIETGNYPAIEGLLDNGVVVINFSRGYPRSYNPYTNFEQWIDHVSYYHHASFFKSAGNKGTETTGPEAAVITKPGLAYNVITVGASDCANNQMLEMSSYDNLSGCRKPDIVLPGYHLLDIPGAGTSLAAPCGSGIAAIMIHAYPSLVSSPTTIKAIIIASASKMAVNPSGTTPVFLRTCEERQGSGVPDASLAITICNAGQYYETTSPTQASNTIHPASFSTNNVNNGIQTVVMTISCYSVVNGPHATTTTAFSYPLQTASLKVYTTGYSTLGIGNMGNSSAQLVRINSTQNTLLMQTVFGSASVSVPVAYAWF